MSKEKNEKNVSIIKFLKENDKTFFVEDNVLWAEKAFMVRAVIDWCLEKKREGEFDDMAFDSFIRVVDRYVKDEVDIEWERDRIIIKTVKN